VLELLFDAAAMAFTFQNLAGVLIGLLLGAALGAIPGLNGTMAIALIVPLTYFWEPLFSIALLMGCWKGSIYGGSISAILLNAPGTPEAAATALDGFPLQRRGEGRKAMHMALFASVAGALVSDVLLLGASGPISNLALRFGPAELTMLIVFSLVLVAGTGGESHLKGLISTMIGVLIAVVGLDPMTAQRRMTFDVLELDGGFDLLAMLIGLLVLSEVINQVWNGEAAEEPGRAAKRVDRSRITWAEIRACAGIIFRSSLIGSFCGALPGVGAITAAFMGYDHARMSSSNPERFGKGELSGVAAPEAANNAVCGSALIPLVTLGIPGSLSVAVIMGAFMVHGVSPGPMLMIEQRDLVYALFLLLLLSDLLLPLVALPLISVGQWLVTIPKKHLYPVIALLCGVGAYSAQQSIFDVNVMVAFAVFGFAMKRLGLSPAALLIAFILAPMAETYMRQALRISRGDMTVFVGSPLAAGLAVATVGLLAWSYFRARRATVPRGRASD
jgi:putative tricarboxylic transport membrane protein